MALKALQRSDDAEFTVGNVDVFSSKAIRQR